MPRPLPIAVAAMLALAVGCSPPAARNDTRGQVVARVDGTELTVHQVNHLLASHRAGSGEKTVRQAALEALIDQHVLAERARREGLDRDPAVLAQVQAASLRIHAQVAADRIHAGQPAPTSPEVVAFHDRHPALFAERRVYTVDELSLAPGAIDLALLRERVAQARRLDDIAGWLQGRAVPFGRQSGVVRPEDLSLAAAADLHALPVGAVTVIATAAGIQVLQLRRADPQPVARDAARAAIERYLIDERRRDAVGREVAALRARARIEYAGEFVGTAAQARTDPPAAASSGAAGAVAGNSPPTPPTPAASTSHLDRGVGGLR